MIKWEQISLLNYIRWTDSSYTWEGYVLGLSEQAQTTVDRGKQRTACTVDVFIDKKLQDKNTILSTYTATLAPKPSYTITPTPANTITIGHSAYAIEVSHEPGDIIAIDFKHVTDVTTVDLSTLLTHPADVIRQHGQKLYQQQCGETLVERLERQHYEQTPEDFLNDLTAAHATINADKFRKIRQLTERLIPRDLENYYQVIATTVDELCSLIER